MIRLKFIAMWSRKALKPCALTFECDIGPIGIRELMSDTQIQDYIPMNLLDLRWTR